MTHFVINTASEPDRSDVEREIRSALESLPGAEIWLVSVLGLRDRPGFLVTIDSGERTLGAWNFERVEEIRPRLTAALAPAAA